MQSVLDVSHTLATGSLSPGSVAVDATIGNGHDTLVLARAVGAEGRVFGFDVQAEALEQTRDRLESAAQRQQVELYQVGHEAMDRRVPTALHGEVGAVMFNLGYLPGSNAQLTTTPDTTIPALASALRLLRPGGRITVVIYTGHEGGAEEAEAVDAWAEELSQEQFQVLSYRFLNQRNHPPRLVAVEKRKEERQNGGMGTAS